MYLDNYVNTVTLMCEHYSNSVTLTGNTHTRLYMFNCKIETITHHLNQW